MILSHFRAGTGAVAIETREEGRLMTEILKELPPKSEVAVTAAPSGGVFMVRLIDGVACKDREPLIPAKGMGQQTLPDAYSWAATAPNRVLIVLDWHMLANTPGHWRMLIESLPSFRAPRAADASSGASLVAYVGPAFDLSVQNPLKGNLPILQFALPDREGLLHTATRIKELPPDDTELIVDALCGLGADAAEQVCAETLTECGRWDVERLRKGRRAELKSAGMEVWESVPELGGLRGLQDYVEGSVIPWLRDSQLSERRILCAGLPGVGKSYWPRWLAHRIGCECVRISVPSLKGGIVGQSEANLRRCLRTIDAMGKHSPLVVVLDEIDTIARDGLDGGTSSGMFAELLTWLQESQSQCVVVATLNHLNKLDAAMDSRFGARFFFDLPVDDERKAICSMWYRHFGCSEPDNAASITSDITDGFSSRELVALCKSVAQLSNRVPQSGHIYTAKGLITPSSVTQAAQLAEMRSAAQRLRRANTPTGGTALEGRHVTTA